MNSTLSYSESKKIRDSYEGLPFQGFWTWLTGKELQEREPFWHTRPHETILWSILWLVGGIVLINFSVLSNKINYLFLIIGIVLATSGARYIVATVIHQAVHQNLLKGKHNIVLAELLSTILIVEPYHSYYQFHTIEHHGKQFSTLEDKDLTAIYSLGFLPGKSIRGLYLNLFKQIFSPVFHVKFLYGRLKSNLFDVPPYRLFMSLVYLAFLFFISWKMGFAWSFFVIILPFVILYQIASLLHLITEHTWLLRSEDQTVKESHSKNSLGRFCGSRCPQGFSPSTWIKWVQWCFSHMFYHLPVRMLILQGSLVCHDWHHRFGKNNDWANFAYLREKYAKKIEEENRFDLIETWGYHSALKHVFESLSKADKIDISNLDYRLN